MKSNLAHEPPIPQGELVQFPKKERQAMSEKFSQGYVQSSQLYRKEVYPFLSDAARHVYFELENRINGFQKDSDFVSYSQLQGNAELEGARVVARASISKGLKELIGHGVITVLATGKKGNKYQINEVSLLGKQYTKKTSSPTELVHVVDQSSLDSRPQLVHVVDTQKKDLKKYIKETHTIENSPKNSVDEILNLWKPNLDSLNSWLKRAGEKSLTQSEMENTLLEVNAHYERQIRSDLVSDSKMYSNFVKWVKGDFSKNKKSNSNVRPSNLNVNDAWADIPQFSGPVQHVEIPEDFI